ncbi:MAG: FtsQ-type POTRA domain-containing protein [Lentisphaeraceae bacterium]|nr:FtsQ-type POTRA domain-containing protein [Lentisphaeraceae bacterium]
MEKHNILGKKAEASAAFKEKLIALSAWIFIIFCTCVVFYFSKIGLKTLFLSSNKHFTLKHIDIKTEGLPQNVVGLVDVEFLKESLQLHLDTDNLFDIDLKSVRSKILKNISVDKAEVTYRFPDTIAVSYSEKRPIARLSSQTLIDKNGFVLPEGRTDLILPQVFSSRIHKPGSTISSKVEDENIKADNESILYALNFIVFNETFRMSYKTADQFIGHKEFASMELLKVKSVSQHDPDALTIMLGGVPEVKLADNTRLKIPIDNIELGVRRACISIIQNAMANKITRKIDARYNSTATE